MSTSLQRANTYSDVHWLIWRDNMRRKSREGKTRGAVFLSIYIQHLHAFWRNPGEDGVIIIFRNSWAHVQVRACYVLPAHIHTDLTRVNDGRLSVQLFVIQQSTLDIIYPSQKKLWDFSLRRTYNILFGKDRSGRRNDIQHDMSHDNFVLTFDETFKILLAASTMGAAACTSSTSSVLCWLMLILLREELRSTNREPASSWREEMQQQKPQKGQCWLALSLQKRLMITLNL